MYLHILKNCEIRTGKSHNIQMVVSFILQIEVYDSTIQILGRYRYVSTQRHCARKSYRFYQYSTCRVKSELLCVDKTHAPVPSSVQISRNNGTGPTICCVSHRKDDDRLEIPISHTISIKYVNAVQFYWKPISFHFITIFVDFGDNAPKIVKNIIMTLIKTHFIMYYDGIISQQNIK